MSFDDNKLNTSDMDSVVGGKDTSRFYRMSPEAILSHIKQVDDPEVAKIVIDKWENSQLDSIKLQKEEMLKKCESYFNKELK